MADDERRMLFDIRGRRKHVIRVVYAVLAILMGASLFLVVGPVSIGELVGGSSATSESVEIFEEQVERIEQRLKVNPDDEDILLSLTRTRLNAARAQQTEVDPTTGRAVVTPQARAEYERATEDWERYLKAAQEDPNASLAQQVSQAWIILAENPGRGGTVESFESLNEAVAAQRVYADTRTSINTVGTLALLEMISGQFSAGEKSAKRAEALARSENGKKALAKQIEAGRKQGKENLEIKKEAEKSEQGQGKEALENPLGGLGGGTTPVSP